MRGEKSRMFSGRLVRVACETYIDVASRVIIVDSRTRETLFPTIFTLLICIPCQFEISIKGIYSHPYIRFIAHIRIQ